jgi:hypothetical protein
MASRYEYYNTGDDNFVYTDSSARWIGQTFTPQTSHTILSIKAKLGKALTPGTATVSIRATSAGKPTGGDLCSGTINGDTLAAFGAEQWYEITLGAGAALSEGMLYAIILRSAAGNVYWRCKGTASYTAGGYCISTNSGSTWSVSGTVDAMFEEWGTLVWGSDPTGINIGDAWKVADWTGSKINVGDAWKATRTVKVNIGDAWKRVYSSPAVLNEDATYILLESGTDDRIEVE